MSEQGLGQDNEAPAEPHPDGDLLSTVVTPKAEHQGFNQFRKSLRFTAISPLDAGGMGEVLRALDTQLGRYVAIKRLHERLADNPEQLGRFSREALVQSALVHPGVVPLHEAGVDETGLPFIAMKEVKGRVLSEVLSSLRLGDPQSLAEFSRNRLLSDFARLCWTVAFAHSKDIVHRDIKPSNVMLGDLGEVYLLDWGIASKPDTLAAPSPPLPDASASLTDPHQALGTPAYMSPEHARGGSYVVFSSDVFALGAILFELLTKKRLNPGGGASEAMMLALLPMEARARERLEASHVAEGLIELVLRATHFEPTKRPSAKQLAISVERLVSVEREREERARRAERYEQQALALLDDGTEEGAIAALRVLTRADALAPTRDRAAKLLAEFVTRADSLGLAGSNQGLNARLERHRHSAVKSSLLIMIPTAVMLSALIWLAGGVRWSLMPMIVGATLITALLLYAQRRGRVPRWHYAVSGPLGGLTAAAFCVVTGPLVLVPVCVLAHFALLVMNSRAGAKVRFRQSALALSCVFAPFLAQLLGVLPKTYFFEQGGMLIKPIGIELTGAALWGFTGVTTVVLLALTMLALARSARDLDRAERTLFAQRWILGSMISENRAETPAQADHG